MAKLTAATVLFEGAQVLRDTLPTLLDAAASSSVEVVIVDNSVTDGPRRIVEELKAGRRDVAYVRHAENPGFAASANEAIARSSGEWVFLVNADVTVSPDAMAAVLRHVSEKVAERPTAVSLVTKGVQTCGISLDRFGYFSDRKTADSAPILGPSGGAAIFHR